MTLFAWFLVILASQLLLYANLQSWGQIGRFLTWLALENALSFAVSAPDLVGDYIAVDGLIKLGVLLSASALILVLAARVDRDSFIVRTGAALALVIVIASCALAAFGFTSAMRHVPLTGSFMINAVRALTGLDGEERLTVPPRDLLDTAFEEVALVGTHAFRGTNFGVERNSNLVLFVLETGSIEFLDVRSKLPPHPLLDRLKRRLFVAKNHYATFPASAESNFSILTGIYPPNALYDTCLIGLGDYRSRHLPGFVPELRARGYQTALYAPFRGQVPADRLVFEQSGFERSIFGEEHDPQKNKGGDRGALEQMTDDIQRWIANKQRFAVAFFPQIGHGPWGTDDASTIQERGNELAMEQLDWLEDIAKLLDAAGELERTVIVITGDHGVRTSIEDPRVRVGMIDRYSLHVPLLLFAPRADYSGTDSWVPTSHVDVAAEMNQLFGLPDSRSSMQGMSFSDPQVARRRQFFVAGWYYGANGYRDPAESAMYSSVLDTAYRRNDRELRFESGDLVKDRPEVEKVRDITRQIIAIQESWILHRVCEPSRQ